MNPNLKIDIIDDIITGLDKNKDYVVIDENDKVEMAAITELVKAGIVVRAGVEHTDGLQEYRVNDV